VLVTSAFTAWAADDPAEAMAQARPALDHAKALGISAEAPRWCWPLAARCAHQVGDFETVRELLALLDAYRPGELAPLLHAERALARARLAAHEGADDASTRFVDAIASLRERGTPYHLAQGLLDHAEHLLQTSAQDDADPLVAEAAAIAERLGAAPVARRAEALRPQRVVSDA
jgi:hypothetical protein